MTVQSVKFSGYKSFSLGEDQEIHLSPYVTVFIGKNNCGTNQNAAIVIDSDRRRKSSNVNTTKVRIRDEFSKINGLCWITQEKEIENYIPAAAINGKYDLSLSNIGQYELFPEYINRIEKNFSSHKVAFAKGIAEHITKENSSQMLDLEKQIRKLYETIQKWNKK